jgi:hypothetical protein
MKSFLEALNHPAEAFRKKNRVVSWTLVLCTIAVNAVVDPLLQYFWGVGTRELDSLMMLSVAGLGALSYLTICMAFWIVCKCFGSKTAIIDHIGAWGISYFPTLLCSVLVALAEVFFFVFWSNSVWGIVLSFAFVGIFLWKSILYYVYLREFAGLRGIRLFGAFAIIGIIIILLAWMNMSVGLKTPVL